MAGASDIGADDRRRVVFFDGVCALCDGTVRFLLARDRRRALRFAPLQGETATAEPALAEMLEHHQPELWSVVYLRGEGERAELLTRSDAILAILGDLGGFWRLLAVARLVPRALRDRVYDLVGRNRYRWFGRFEACRLPRPGEAGRFLD